MITTMAKKKRIIIEFPDDLTPSESASEQEKEIVSMVYSAISDSLKAEGNTVSTPSRHPADSKKVSRQIERKGSGSWAAFIIIVSLVSWILIGAMKTITRWLDPKGGSRGQSTR